MHVWGEKLQTCSYSQADPKINIHRAKICKHFTHIVFWLVFFLYKSYRAIVYTHEIVLDIQLLKFTSYPFFCCRVFSSEAYSEPWEPFLTQICLGPGVHTCLPPCLQHLMVCCPTHHEQLMLCQM